MPHSRIQIPPNNPALSAEDTGNTTPTPECEGLVMNVGVAVAAAAAVAREQRQRQEEEEMTLTAAQDLADGWEFKILRATTAMFRDSRKLQAVLDEEKTRWLGAGGEVR